MDLQVVLNTFATDIFRKQADYDYIAARSNFRLQLRQQFLWSSQQAIEKYLKAILLFNGKSARYIDPISVKERKKEYGHNIVALFDAVKSISIFKFELEIEDEKFLRYLADQGPNRYVSTTAYSTVEALRRLDSTVWHIRRYCQYMPDRGIGSPTAVPSIREAHVKAALNPKHKEFPQKFRLIAGELEKIIQRPSSNPARRALVWANLYYGSKRRTVVRYTTFSSTEIPPKDRGWIGVNWSEIDIYVKI